MFQGLVRVFGKIAHLFLNGGSRAVRAESVEQIRHGALFCVRGGAAADVTGGERGGPAEKKTLALFNAKVSLIGVTDGAARRKVMLLAPSGFQEPGYVRFDV